MEKERVEQFDLFGGCCETKEVVRKSNKYRTMQEIHGVLEGKTCKTCCHCLKLNYHDHVYHKCELWKLSHGEATDIRLKDKACKKYGE